MIDQEWETATRAMDRHVAVMEAQKRMRLMYTFIAIGLFLVGAVAGYFYAIEKCLH